jgi:hypothetical protein
MSYGTSRAGDTLARLCRTLAVRAASAMIGCSYTLGTILLIIWVEP